jgi:hypothetical protein
MECEMSRSRILSCDVFISINVHFLFLYHRNDAENDYRSNRTDWKTIEDQG